VSAQSVNADHVKVFTDLLGVNDVGAPGALDFIIETVHAAVLLQEEDSGMALLIRTVAAGQADIFSSECDFFGAQPPPPSGRRAKSASSANRGAPPAPAPAAPVDRAGLRAEMRQLEQHLAENDSQLAAFAALGGTEERRASSPSSSCIPCGRPGGGADGAGAGTAALLDEMRAQLREFHALAERVDAWLQARPPAPPAPAGLGRAPSASAPTPSPGGSPGGGPASSGGGAGVSGVSADGGLGALAARVQARAARLEEHAAAAASLREGRERLLQGAREPLLSAREGVLRRVDDRALADFEQLAAAWAWA
jgi:hypothetical protein